MTIMKMRAMNKAVLNTRDTENNQKIIEGYFAVFDERYELWDGVFEMVSPYAFDGQLNADVRCLIDHNTNLVLGRTTANTLNLRTDEKGLWGTVIINEDDTDALNLYARVKRGDVSNCSFGFDITAEERSEIDEGVLYRINAVRLHEISVCTFPAYETTEVKARDSRVKNELERRLNERKIALKAKLKGER